MKKVSIELTEKEIKFLMLAFCDATKDLKWRSEEGKMADKIYDKLNVNNSLDYLLKK